MHLPNVSIWLALAFEFHTHHVAAKAWYKSSNEACYFCRWTQQGFLRLATNANVFKVEAVTLNQAWHMYDQILSDPRLSFAQEPKDVEVHWRSYTQRKTFSPKIWSDAYLAAFAKAESLEVVTLDKGFTQYKGVKCNIL